MTREDEIEAVLAGYGLVIIKNPAPSTGGAAIMAAMLEYGQQRADAEAAAMRERAAEKCQSFSDDPWEGEGKFKQGFAAAAFLLAGIIRALPTTGEV